MSEIRCPIGGESAYIEAGQGPELLKTWGWGYIFSEGGWLCPKHYAEAKSKHTLTAYAEALREVLRAQVAYYGSEDAALRVAEELRALLENELDSVT